MHKISIVGAGRVGESAAQFIAAKGLCREITLIDLQEGPTKGVALDIWETASLFSSDTRVHGSSNLAEMADSDLIIVTAGFPRKPGMSRSDLLEANVKVIDQIADAAKQHAPDSKMLVVSNPVDVMTYRAWKRTGWERNRVFGQAGILDASRMASFISDETGFSVQHITTMVLGGHGDTMVPLPRYCTVNGIPVCHFIGEEKLQAINERTRDGGAEVLSLRENSSAYDAPGAAVMTMVDAMVSDRKSLLPCVAILENEYNCNGLAIGVPCTVGANGIESIVEIPLNDSETSDFNRSVAAIKKNLALLPE